MKSFENFCRSIYCLLLFLGLGTITWWLHPAVDTTILWALDIIVPMLIAADLDENYIESFLQSSKTDLDNLEKKIILLNDRTKASRKVVDDLTKKVSDDVKAGKLDAANAVIHLVAVIGALMAHGQQVDDVKHANIAQHQTSFHQNFIRHAFGSISSSKIATYMAIVLIVVPTAIYLKDKTNFPVW